MKNNNKTVGNAQKTEETAPKEAVSGILRILFGPGVSSTDRLGEMLGWITDHGFDPEIAWPVFHESWNCCDLTGPYDEELASFMETALTVASMKAVNPVDYLHPDDKAAYDALPDNVLIHRGCSRSRVNRASWTTDLKVAEGYAAGHRGISVKNPVVASLQIPKSAIIGFYTARQENEVVIAPHEFGRLSPAIREISEA